MSAKSSMIGKATAAKKNNKNMKQFLTKNITGKPEEVFQIASPKSYTATKPSLAAFEPVDFKMPLNYESQAIPSALSPDQVALRNDAVNHM